MTPKENSIDLELKNRGFSYIERKKITIKLYLELLKRNFFQIVSCFSTRIFFSIILLFLTYSPFWNLSLVGWVIKEKETQITIWLALLIFVLYWVAFFSGLGIFKLMPESIKEALESKNKQHTHSLIFIIKNFLKKKIVPGTILLAAIIGSLWHLKIINFQEMTLSINANFFTLCILALAFMGWTLIGELAYAGLGRKKGLAKALSAIALIIIPLWSVGLNPFFSVKSSIVTIEISMAIIIGTGLSITFLKKKLSGMGTGMISGGFLDEITNEHEYTDELASEEH